MMIAQIIFTLDVMREYAKNAKKHKIVSISPTMLNAAPIGLGSTARSLARITLLSAPQGSLDAVVGRHVATVTGMIIVIVCIQERIAEKFNI